MKAAKRNGWKDAIVSPIARIAKLTGGSNRSFVAGVVLLAVCVVGALVAWKKWGTTVVSSPRYTLSAENIEVTQQPPWIHADVKAEVIRDGSLSNLQILDEQVTVKVAGAFSVHNWVADVKRVSKHYGPKIIVDLEYRRPVAMVEVTTDGGRGLLPVDATGVLLPPDDFSPTEVRDFLRVSVGDSIPAGPIGTAWGDERVAGAAKIAAAWGSQWQPLELYRIVAVSDGTSRSRASPSYELYTRQGTRIIWGCAPGQESSGEATATQKIARLVRYVAEHGALDGQTAVAAIDLRDSRDISVTPRTAGLQPVSPL
jgi:hypothetical protein